MSSGLILILAVAIAYLAARVAFDWLARRFLIVSGAEYLLLGILLGPQVAGALSAETLAAFAPLTTLSLGWIGAIVGMQFFLPGLVRIRALIYKLAFAEAIGTLLLVGAAQLAIAIWLFDLTLFDSLFPALAFGAVAVASAPAGIEVVARRLSHRGPIVQQLQVATAIDALVAIGVIGILLCFGHPGDTSTVRPITTTEWTVITIAIGVVGGSLFHLFLGSEHNPDRLFISLAGAIILTSGAAAYLHLSPLFAAMVMGATLVNTSRNREDIARTLHGVERPFYFVLLVFAGAAWEPGLRAWVVPVAVFLVVRISAKIGSAALATRLSDAGAMLGTAWGRALLGQGGLALALALEYMRLSGGVLANIVFTAAIASVLLTDFMSARIIHSVVAPLVRQKPGEIASTAAAGDR
ncbi:MAG: hypothetical protein H0W30_16920 [Gemmatimonadaceae bacterium]|nr:hypothetical protein [Gemmatimonadaceae bacterium]